MKRDFLTSAERKKEWMMVMRLVESRVSTLEPTGLCELPDWLQSEVRIEMKKYDNVMRAVVMINRKRHFMFFDALELVENIGKRLGFV